jgi:hypothetical protein
LPFFFLNFYPFAQMYRLDMQMPNILPPSFHPSIPSPPPFLLPPSSFQNTHARRFERAKSIERCQRARGLEDSRDVSDRTLFFLPSSFLIFLYSLLLFFFFFMSSLLVKSDMEKTSCWRKDQDEKKKKSEDTFKMSVRERRDCVCVLCHSRRRNGCDLFMFP